MPITKEQLEKRKKYIGSSEVAAIMGRNPYENAYDVWFEKTGKLETEKEETEDMQLGHQFESVAIKLAEKQLGQILTGTFLEFIIEGAHIISHPDGIVQSIDKNNEPVEAKESGIRNPFYAKENWGDANTDQVPDMVLIQAQVHIIATKKSICHIPAILGGRGFVMFFTPEAKWLQEQILNAAGHFWDEHIVKDIPPKNVLPTMDTLKRVLRQPKKIIEVPEQVAIDHIAAKEVLKSAEKNFEEKDIALKTVLGDAEVGRFSQGQFTFFKQNRTVYNVPDEIKIKYRDQIIYRVLRIKKNVDTS